MCSPPFFTAWCVFSTEAVQLVTVQGASFAPQAGGSGNSGLPIISRDGRYVFIRQYGEQSDADEQQQFRAAAPV